MARINRPMEFVSHSGSLIASVPETLLACATDLSTLDVMVLIDSALHQHACSEAELLAISRGRRGGQRLRQALALTDARSESCWESLLRVLHTSSGLRVTPQFRIDLPGGSHLRADLLLDGTRTLHEYDGADHRTPAGQRRDLSRDRDLLSVGYTRRGYTAFEVARTPASIVREACTSVGTEFRATAMRRWNRLWAESLFSPTGTGLALARWQ
jgi:very-short-patch-repair endonuclease